MHGLPHPGSYFCKNSTNVAALLISKYLIIIYQRATYPATAIALDVDDVLELIELTRAQEDLSTAFGLESVDKG